MSRSHLQRGFTLVAALFLIVAGLLAAAAMVATTLSRSRSTVLGLDASQARFAAQGGLQVARANALAGGCAAVPASLTIEGFTIESQCTALVLDEGATPYPAYRLQVRAWRGSLQDSTFVQRRLVATVVGG